LANRLLRFRHNYVADATFVGWSFWHVSLVQIGGARKLKRGAFSVGTAAIRDAKGESRRGSRRPWVGKPGMNGAAIRASSPHRPHARLKIDARGAGRLSSVAADVRLPQQSCDFGHPI
jgi:hypothetical protein